MHKRLLLAALITAAPAGAYDFKGIEIGKPYAEKKFIDTFGVSSMFKRPERHILCSVPTTIAGKDATLHIDLTEDEVVYYMFLRFDADDGKSIEAALIDKFGKPGVISNPTLTTRMGVSVSQVELSWLNKETGARLMYRRYAGNIDKGALSFLSKEYIAQVTSKIDSSKSDL